jgi:ligand-binding sensor domain-containing protein
MDHVQLGRGIPWTVRLCLARRLGPLLATATLLVTGAATTSALEPPPLPTRYTVRFWNETQGLPHNFVYTMLQTRDGYLWLGTRRGLARFDGVRFVVYDDLRPGQLRDSEVRTLAEDDDGSLWIGTHGGGVTHLRKGVFTSYSTEDGLPSDTITAMRKVPGGPLWIGSPAGLAAFDGRRFQTYTVEDGLPSANVLSLHLDSQAVLWIGTGRGLASYSDGGFVDHAARHAGLGGTVRSIAGDSRQGIWLDRVLEENAAVGHLSEGLRLFKNGRVRAFTTSDGLPSNEVTALLDGGEGVVWIATVGGLGRYRNGRLEVLRGGVMTEHEEPLDPLGTRRPLSAECLLLDHEGSLWVGTRYSGLGRLRTALFASFGSGGASSVFQDREGTVWVATTEGLWWRRGGDTGTYELPGSLPPGPLADDAQGRLWVGTNDGVLWARQGQPLRAAVPELAGVAVSVLFDDGRGNMWIGGRTSGLYRWRAGRLTHYTPRDGLAGRQVRAIARDSSGGIWVGTKDGGLSHWADGVFRTIGEGEGLPSASVSALVVDPSDVVWAATRRGLVRIRGAEVTTITAEHGLPANYFYQIVSDGQDHLWLPFASGIARVSRSELEEVADGDASAVHATVLGAASGMRNSTMTVSFQPTGWRDRDGRLWFATGDGAAVVASGRWLDNTVPPQVHVEEVHADGRLAAPHEGSVETPAGRGELTVRYTATSFADPDRVEFEYRLAGFDHDWVKAGTRRVAYYTNLPPGDYRFMVRATNDDGIQSDTAAEVAIRILPHFYQTVWFYAACALGLALLGAATQRVRVRLLKRRASELSAKVEEALAEMRVLRGLLPICAWCKKVRDDENSWKGLEAYIREHSEAEFTHAICPSCADGVRRAPRGTTTATRASRAGNGERDTPTCTPPSPEPAVSTPMSRLSSRLRSSRGNAEGQALLADVVEDAPEEVIGRGGGRMS